MTLTGRIFLAWELFIVQVKVVGSLSVLSDTRADFLHFPWRSLQNLPELTKCPVMVVFAGVGSMSILNIGMLVFWVYSNDSRSHTERLQDLGTSRRSRDSLTLSAEIIDQRRKHWVCRL